MHQDTDVRDAPLCDTTTSGQRRLARAPQVAAFLGLPISTLYDRARSNPPQIPGVVRIGRLIRFDLAVIEAWVDAGGDRRATSQARELDE